jgi:hypothetical protein
VTLVHADHEEGDSDEEILEKQLIYKCDLQLHVKGLSSGYCREVHGQVIIRTQQIQMDFIVDEGVNFTEVASPNHLQSCLFSLKSSITVSRCYLVGQRKRLFSTRSWIKM